MAGLAHQQATYLLLFGVSGAVSLVFAYYVRARHDARGTKTLSYALAAVGLWAFNSAARTVTGDPTLTYLLLSTEVFFGIATARLWFVFAAQYTNRSIHRNRTVQWALYGLVTAAIVVPLTNPIHGLMWASVTPVADPFLHYEIAKGPAHYALTVAGYGIVAAGLYYLLRMLRSTSHTKAVVSLVVGFLLLVSANALPYVVDTAITHSTTITPLGGTMFVFMSAVAIRHNLLTVTPIARNRVFTAINDPVVLLDRNRRIIDHNPAFAAAFTRGADVSHDTFDAACPRLADAVGEDIDEPKRVVVTGENGSERFYTLTASPVESGPHDLGRVLVFREITDLLTSQQEVARKDSQLDEFSDSVAHDIRNPLSVIVAHTDLIRTHLEQVDSGDADYDHHLSVNSLDQLDESSRRISSIVDDFLKVTREAKSLHDVEPLDFETFVREQAEGHVDTADLLVPTTGEFYASRSHAGLLLDTVFRNVAHRAEDDLSVTARLTEDGFVVEDTGLVVPPSDADHLLEYGYTTRYRGEGLGLSVAKTLAESHDWSISIDATYKEGLRVVVTGVRTQLVAEDGEVPARRPI